jgi:FkbM family methyltransferase
MSIHELERGVITELSERPTVVDVGANVGEFSAAVLELRPGATVYVSEPNPPCRDKLRERFGSGVVLIPALGAQAGALTLHRGSEYDECATLHPRGARVPELVQGPALDVEVVTLDSLAIEHIDLLKIDAEGSEPEVIEGARDTLLRTDAVLFEWISGATRYRDSSELRRAVALLDRAGFEVRVLGYPDPLDLSDRNDGPAVVEFCIARRLR